MKANVLGIQKVDYISRRTGEQVLGTTLHVSYCDANVDGLAVDGVFLSSRLNLPVLASLKPGSSIDIEYNNRGYVQNVTLLK